MRPRGRRALLLAATAAAASALGLTACASLEPPGQNLEQKRQISAWNGRLALQISEHLSTPAQSWSATFSLQGSAEVGMLTLLNPFGTVIAQLQWTPQGAALDQDGARQEAATLADLLHTLTGSALPIAALFDWLQGQDSPERHPGWQVDLSGYAQGRIRAQRQWPAPEAVLRIVID